MEKELPEDYKRKISDSQSAQILRQLPFYFDDFIVRIKNAKLYHDNLKDIKKLDVRSLRIYHKSLKRKSLVKITNPENGNSLIAEVKSAFIQMSKLPQPKLAKTQKGKIKTNIIQNVANKNEWKDQPPEPELARRIGEDAWKDDEIDVKQYHSGRTVPSQNINPVDRSDRPGEDVEMVTKTKIDADFNDLDSEIIDIIKNEEIHQKKKKKVEWETMISDIDDLLDQSKLKN